MTPIVGEIRMFAGSFAPVGWALCDGSPLSRTGYPALFQAIGTTYGGIDPMFNLPNLGSRAPLHAGTGPDGTTYPLGASGGVEAVWIGEEQMPTHTHALAAANAPGVSPTPAGNLLAQTGGGIMRYYEGSPNDTMSGLAVKATGGSQPHENMQPFLCVTFIIFTGVMPPNTEAR
jgi:microcystin-dependent protein